MKKFIFSALVLCLFAGPVHALAPIIEPKVNKSVDEGPEVCTDADLPNYTAHKFKGDKLGMSDSYVNRYLHLVAPEHPMNAKIRADGKEIEGKDSPLVMRVPHEVVAGSRAYNELLAEIRADKLLADKLAVTDSKNLHITIDWVSEDIDMEAMEKDGRLDRVREIGLRAGPFRVKVRGPWISGWSEGRIYLLAYPEIVDEDKGKEPGSGRRSVMERIKKEVGHKEGNFFSVGFAGIKDALTAEETARLKAICDKYWNADEPLFDFTVNQLSVVCSQDSLLTLADIKNPEAIIPLYDADAVEDAA